MKCLSVQQPWAWLLVHGHKDIENRTWRTHVRGWVLVHAGKGVDCGAYNGIRDEFPALRVPDAYDVTRGAIVGAMRVDDCVTESASRWFAGPFGFVIGKAVAFEKPVTWRGALGLFPVNASGQKCWRKRDPLTKRQLLHALNAITSNCRDGENHAAIITIVRASAPRKAEGGGRRAVIQPYYHDSQVTLYHGNSMELLPKLKLRAPCIITDPPYEETGLAWDRWPRGWPAHVLKHAAAPNASLWCFGSLRMFLEKRDEFTRGGWRMVQDVVWEKQNGSNLLADRFRRVHELAVQFTPKRAKWGDVFKSPQYTYDGEKKRIIRQAKPAHWGDIDGGKYETETGGRRLVRSVIYARNCHRSAVHETEKPEPLLRTLVAYSCPPGSIVLGIFGGSASSARAARQLGLRAVVIEVREDACEKAARTLQQQQLGIVEGAA